MLIILVGDIPSSIINYRFLTTETNSKALYIFCCLFTTLSVKLFVVNVQIFLYNCIFGKENNIHVLKMKAHFQKEPHFENESLHCVSSGS